MNKIIIECFKLVKSLCMRKIASGQFIASIMGTGAEFLVIRVKGV